MIFISFFLFFYFEYVSLQQEESVLLCAAARAGTGAGGDRAPALTTSSPSLKFPSGHRSSIAGIIENAF